MKEQLELNDLQVIWDAQERAPVYTLNRDVVHARVKSEATLIERGLNLFEIVSLVVLFGLGGAAAWEPLVEGVDRHQILDTMICFAAGGYLAGELRRRRREGTGFADSVVGELDRAIFHLEVYVRRFRVFPWIVLGPVLLLMLLKLPIHAAGKPWWLIVASFLCVIGTIHVLRSDVTNVKLPQLASLKALREQLVREPESAG